MLTFQETLTRKNWVHPALSENGEDTKFDYQKMTDAGYTFLDRVLSHEITHVGADVHELGTSVWGLPGSLPSWINQDGDIKLGSKTVVTLYHRGDVFEYEAYLKQVTYKDNEYGFATNVYFRAMAGMHCYLPQNPLLKRTYNPSDDPISQSIWKYIKSDQQNLRSFKPDNHDNRGSFDYPELSH